MSTRRTRADAGWVDRKLDGCRYCGGELPSNRRTFCSGAKTTHGRERRPGHARRVRVVLRHGHGCVHEWCLRTQPAYLRSEVWDRDHGICATCGRQCCEKNARRDELSWQADHIVPVCEGGGECDLANMRTLCRDCHRGVTTELQKKRAQQRRAGESAA